MDERSIIQAAAARAHNVDGNASYGLRHDDAKQLLVVVVVVELVDVCGRVVHRLLCLPRNSRILQSWRRACRLAQSPASLACIEWRPLGRPSDERTDGRTHRPVHRSFLVQCPRLAGIGTTSCALAGAFIPASYAAGGDKKLFTVIRRRRSLTRHCHFDGVCRNARQRSKPDGIHACRGRYHSVFSEQYVAIILASIIHSSLCDHRCYSS